MWSFCFYSHLGASPMLVQQKEAELKTVQRRNFKNIKQGTHDSYKKKVACTNVSRCCQVWFKIIKYSTRCTCPVTHSPVGSRETCSFTQKKSSVLKPARWDRTGLNFTLPLDDANIDQALFGPPLYRDMVQESTALFTLLHLVEKTTADTGTRGLATEWRCLCQRLTCFHV